MEIRVDVKRFQGIEPHNTLGPKFRMSVVYKGERHLIQVYQRDR